MIARRLTLSLLSAATMMAACVTPPEAPHPALTAQELAGKRIFTRNCASCHATTPEIVIVGPSLFGLLDAAASRVEGQDAHTYIALSIIDPSIYVNEGFADLMPKTFGRTLSGEELDSLIAYLLTLK